MMKSGIVVFATAAVLLAGCENLKPGTAATPRKPKVLLVMFDGLRADALETAHVPAIDSLRTGSWAPGYAGAWSLTGLAVPDARPSSAANHTAISTAVNAKKTRVFQNGETKKGDYATWPTWLTRVTAARPETTALFMFSWKENADYPPTDRVRFIHDTDEHNGAALPKILAAANAPDAIQYFIDLPDHGGHRYGFYPFSRTYLAAVHQADAYLGAALEAIRSRPTFDQEDWLVLATADHGGYLRSHGLWGGHSSTVPIVLSGRNIPSGRLAGAPHHYDLTATALVHFGLDPAALGLDGRPLVTSAAPAPARPLGDGLVAAFDFQTATPENAVKDGPKAKLVGTRAVSGVEDGILRFHGTNAMERGGVVLEGSDKLSFEHGGDFTAVVWARLPAAQSGDPVLFSNKDWDKGVNPGLALVAAKKMEGARAPGVVLNAGRPNAGRIDVGQFDVEPGVWTFYAVVRTAEGVLVAYQGRSDGRLNWCCWPADDIVVSTGLPFALGQDGTGAYPHALTGDLDDFALWTRALGHDEIKALFRAGRQGLALRDLL